MQFVKFVVVGASGTALHYAILIFFVSALDSDPALGAMVGATFGAVCNYWLNYRFTFCSNRPHFEAMPRFIVMAGVGIFFNGMIVKALTLASIYYLLSQLIATLTILIMNFLLSKLWIFRKNR